MSDDRLLVAPVFVLSAPRSGSTLMRAILGSHSALWAPHEIPLTRITVDVPFGMPLAAVRMLGHDQQGLEHLLWDRLLALELARTGKATAVLKSPIDTLGWERLPACWPDARFVFLIRHPGSVLDSWQEAVGHAREPSAAHLLRFMTALQAARAQLPGLTVRYEDLTADPGQEMRRVCAFLSVGFEPGMLAYAGAGPFRRGVGDWTAKIHTGQVQPARPLPGPGAVPEVLHPICQAWGYGVPSIVSSPDTFGVISSVPSEVL